MNSATGQPMGAQTGDSGDHWHSGGQGRGIIDNGATVYVSFNKENITILQYCDSKFILCYEKSTPLAACCWLLVGC